MRPILSSNELRKISKAVMKGLSTFDASIDLGLSKTKVKLGKDGFYLEGKLVKLPKIREKDNSCYVLIGKELQKAQFLSEETGFLYKLEPTSYRPILKVSGTSMHKKPFLDRLHKDQLKGRILDSGTGLGYSAILAAKSAKQVITVEIDQNVIEMAKLNPYSQDLFSKKNIKLVLGDIVEEILKFKDEEFNFIVFDAGTAKASGHFFSLDNYKQAYRILKTGGRLYHYLPRPQITKGRDFAAEVIKRIEKAGFSRIERNIEDSYVIADK